MENEKKPEKKPRERKSFVVRFEDAAGNRLAVLAKKKGDGAVTFVEHRAGKTKTKGATQRYENIEAALAAQAKVVEKCVAAGWRKKESKRGFVAKPDSFDLQHIPQPAKARKSAA